MSATDQIFYPSAVAHVYLRFDENLHVLDRPLPRAFSEGGYNPGQPGQLSPRPLIAQTGNDNLSAISNILPKTASVDLSGYRQAGKWALDFDYRNFPIDPRLCRAVLVEIHLGCVQAQDFSDGMARTKPTGGRKSVLETRNVSGAMREETLAIMGLADTIHSAWSDKGAMVHMEGRDLRGIMLDAGARPDVLAKLKLDQPINLVVAQILALHPFGIGITVSVNDDDWPGGTIPSPADAQGLTRVNRGAFGTVPGMQPRADPSQLSVWDIITNYCTVVGAVPYFIGQVLHVRPARSLYSRFKLDARGNPAVPTPFQGGQVRTVHTQAGTEKLTIRRLVFGGDVTSLEFERKLGGVKVPQVEIVSHNTSSTKRGLGRLLIARFPPDPLVDSGDPAAVDETSSPTSDATTEAAKVTSVAPGGQTHKQIIRLSFPGIQSQERLNRIARDLWEEIGRGEMGGKVSTKNLTTFGGTNQDPDLLSIRPGDPIEIVFDSRSLKSAPPLSHEVADHNRRSFEDEVSFIAQRLGGDRNLARVLVATARNQVQELQSFFRVNNVHFGWDSENGVEVQFDYQNFLEARYDIDKQQENKRPTRLTAVAGRK